jgi:hypothetical protein
LVCAAYGFTVSANGLGAYSFNVGADGAAFDVANNTTLDVYALLQAVNDQAVFRRAQQRQHDPSQSGERPVQRPHAGRLA